MNICRCPVCGSKARYVKELQNEPDTQVFYCEECKKRGMTIEVRSSNKDTDTFDLLNIWNTRPIHKKLISDREYLYRFLKIEAGECNSEELEKFYNSDASRLIYWDSVFGIDYSPCAGFFCIKSGKIYRCYTSHIDTLFSIFSLQNADGNLYNKDGLDAIKKFIIEKGIASVTYFSKSCTLEVNPKKISDKQIMALYDEFYKNQDTTYKEISSYCISFVPDNKMTYYTNKLDFYNALLSIK